MPDSDKLLSAQVVLPGEYVFCAFLGSLGIRVVLAILYALELALQGGWSRLKEGFLGGFLGNRQAQPGNGVEGGDYWTPYLLGVIELIAYPLLIATSEWQIIGAWFTLKTVAQYGHWNRSRSTFNRFLIGNALVVIFAYQRAIAGYITFQLSSVP